MSRSMPASRGVQARRFGQFQRRPMAACAPVVLVRPLEVTQTLESVAVAGVGAAVEKEALRLRGGIVEIRTAHFFPLIGRGVAGSLASAPLVGTIETFWSN